MLLPLNATHWDDDSARTILRLIRHGIAGGRDDPHPRDDHAGSARAALAKLLDIQMLTMHTRRERTCVEYAKLCAEEKFRLERVIETRSDVQILEAIPV